MPTKNNAIEARLARALIDSMEDYGGVDEFAILLSNRPEKYALHLATESISFLQTNMTADRVGDDVLDRCAKALAAEYYRIWPGSRPRLLESKKLASAVLLEYIPSDNNDDANNANGISIVT